MAVKVFLLGRPGSGKTSAFYNIEKIAHKKKKKATRFREYIILRDMIHQDSFKDKFRLVEFGGFDILDFSVLNESAKHLEKQIQSYLSVSAEENELIFIELARDDYSQAMKCFSPEFLQDSYFFFIEADVETCIDRIHRRVAHPRKTDGHYVSDYILKSYYSKNNLPYMSSKFKLDYGIQKNVMVIENTGSSQDFAKKTKNFAKIFFKQESSNDKETRLILMEMLILCSILSTVIFLLALSKKSIPDFLIHTIHVLMEVPPSIYFLGIITFVLLCMMRHIRHFSSQIVTLLKLRSFTE